MKRIDEMTLTILSRVSVEDNKVFLTCGQLDRKDYQAVNKILELMGGKWNRKGKAHIFPEDPTERLEHVLLTGQIEEPKKYGYFPTPKKVAEYIIELADISSDHYVLEPSAGQGALADLVLGTGAVVDCIELQSDNVAVLKEKNHSVIAGDFLSIPAASVYDRVLMNPPFSKQTDIDHVLHALYFLKEGGKLVSIMSAGVLFRDNKKTKDFREMVRSAGGIFERLPEGSFKESGTMVNTCVLVMERTA